MPDPEQPFGHPLAWWSTIQGAVSEHKSTAEVWDAIHSYSVDQGIREPPNLFDQVNALRSSAKELRDKGTAIMRAADSAPVTADYIGTYPYGRPPTSQAIVQEYLARVTYSYRGPQGVGVDYVTLKYSELNLPGTVGQLRTDLALGTSGKASGYDQTLLDIQTVEIGRA